MRPFSFENRQIPSTGNELSAEWNERCRDFLAIEIEHCWIVDRLRGNHIGLHNELLSFRSCGSPPAASVDRPAHPMKFHCGFGPDCAFLTPRCQEGYPTVSTGGKEFF